MKQVYLGNHRECIWPLNNNVDIAVSGADDGYGHVDPERHASEIVVNFTGNGVGFFLHGNGELGKSGRSRPIQPARHKHASSCQFPCQDIAPSRVVVLNSEVGIHKPLAVWDTDSLDENGISIPVDDLKPVRKRDLDGSLTWIKERCGGFSVTDDEFCLSTSDIKLASKPDYRGARSRCGCPSTQCTDPVAQASCVSLNAEGRHLISGEESEKECADEHACRKSQNRQREFPSTPHGDLHSIAGGVL